MKTYSDSSPCSALCAPCKPVHAMRTFCDFFGIHVSVDSTPAKCRPFRLSAHQIFAGQPRRKIRVRNRRALYVVDGVVLLRVEAGERKRELRRRRPIRARVAAPRRLRLEVGVAECGGIGVVEVGVGRNPESVSAARAQFQAVRRAKAARQLRRKHRLRTAGKNLLARARRQAPALFRRPQIQIHVAGAAIARMNAEIIAVDAVAVRLQAPSAAASRRSSLAERFSVRRSDACHEPSIWLFS